MTSPPAEPAAASPKPWWRRTWVVVLAVLVVLGVAFRVALPWAIARAVEWQVPKQVGLPVRIVNVDLWLLRAAVAVEGLVVGRRQDAGSEAGPDPATALLRFERLLVDLDWSDLFDRRIRLTELALDGPRVRVEREADGRIDPLGTSGEPPAPEPAEPEEPSEPWAFAVDRFDLERAELELFDLASQQTPVEFALAGLGLSDVSVAGSDLGLGGIEIQAPELRVDRDFVFAQGAAPGAEPAPAESTAAAEPASAPPPAEPGEPLTYQIERIAIQDAAFTLRTDAGPLDVRIRLTAERVNARSGELFPIDLELGLGQGSLALQGQLGLNPPAYEGRLAYADLPLPPLTVAARPEVAEWVKSCHAFGDLSVKAHLAGLESGVRVAGTAHIRDLAVGDPKAEEVSLAWQELEIVAREVLVPLPEEGAPARPTRIALERVRLEGADGRYTLPATSLEELLGAGAPAAEGQGEPEAATEESPAAQPAGTEAGDAPAPLELSLDSLEIVGARARFRDQTVTPAYDTRVRDLSVVASDLRFPELRARNVRVRGIIPDATRFDLRGGLDQSTGEFHFELERLALPPFNSYAAGAGYTVGGEASLDSTLRMRGARYQADNQLVLHQLRVDAQKAGDFEGRFGVPIDLALALLRDPKGDIRLPIPVSVGESGAGVDLGAIVTGALRHALTGALASPLKMVGAVLPTGGGGKPSFEPLACVAGGEALAPEAQPRLEPLANLLAQRPALGFRLAGGTAPDDRPVVAEQILVERALAGEDLPEVEDAGFLARRRVTGALAARGRGESEELSAEDQALLARYVAAVVIPPERMSALARRRAEAVRDALVAGHAIDAQRLEIAEPGEADAPGVAIELVAAAVE